MKKNIALFLVLFFTIFKSQNHRFVYEYQYAVDSLKKDSILKDIMFLDIKDNISTFESLGRKQLDSALQDVSKLLKNNNLKKIDIFTSIKVTKNPSKEIYTSVPIGRYMYKVKSESKINWKILPETQKLAIIQYKKP